MTDYLIKEDVFMALTGDITDCTIEEFIARLRDKLSKLPSVTPKEKTGHCKDCKWWKDNDGVYRRGVGAESKCPINRKEVYEGNGYCFLFEPQESEDKE